MTAATDPTLTERARAVLAGLSDAQRSALRQGEHGAILLPFSMFHATIGTCRGLTRRGLFECTAGPVGGTHSVRWSSILLPDARCFRCTDLGREVARLLAEGTEGTDR